MNKLDETLIYLRELYRKVEEEIKKLQQIEEDVKSMLDNDEKYKNEYGIHKNNIYIVSNYSNEIYKLILEGSDLFGLPDDDEKVLLFINKCDDMNKQFANTLFELIKSMN